MKYVPRVLRYALPYWPLAIAAAMGAVLLALAGLLGPWPLKILVDNVLGDQPLPAALQPIGQIIGPDRGALLLAAAGGLLLVALLENGLNVANE
jgi:ATP-binding cassette subfamily B protein